MISHQIVHDKKVKGTPDGSRGRGYSISIDETESLDGLA